VNTVDRGVGFPVAAVVLGAIGTGFVVLGILGRTAPQAVGFAPALRETVVSSALVLSGLGLLAVEAAMLFGWARRRASAAKRSGDAP
jgi:hypothetical protein